MKKLFISLILLTTIFFLISCSSTSDTEFPIPNLEMDISDVYTPEIEDEDINSVVTSTDRVISFNNNSIISSTSSVNIENTTVTISSGGVYEINGTSDEATIFVNASSDDIVTLVLNNLILSSSNGPIIYIENADKVIIQVLSSTTNSLTDLSDTEYEKDAVIYSKDDLTINGTGSLSINAGLQKGIKSNDDLIIYGTELIITSTGHAIKASGSITMSNVTLSIDSQSDGIQSDNDEDIDECVIYLLSGTYTIHSYGDSISSAYDLYIYSGTYQLNSSYQNNNITETSGKAIKADHSIYLVDGVFDINSKDDAIHSDDGIIIFNGSYTIQTEDDGIHANQSLTIQDGSFTIDSFEGLEGKYINISDGTFNITASDDGINASDPDIDRAVVDVPNGGTADPDTSTALLQIDGGLFYITSFSDSIDANGSITINGGSFYINGPTSGLQSIVDYDLTFVLNGGSFVGVAGYGKESKFPTDNSTQVSITYNTGSLQAIDSEIQLLNEDGQEVLSFTPSKSYQVIFLTSSDLEFNETYTLSINGVVKATLLLDGVTNTYNLTTTTLPPRR